MNANHYKCGCTTGTWDGEPTVFKDCGKADCQRISEMNEYKQGYNKALRDAIKIIKSNQDSWGWSVTDIESLIKKKP